MDEDERGREGDQSLVRLTAAHQESDGTEHHSGKTREDDRIIDEWSEHTGAICERAIASERPSGRPDLQKAGPGH